jgi:Icc-related predicted phosphoesterase
MLACVTREIDQRRAAGDHSPRVIVVGHHAPSRASTHPRYQGDHHLNGAYSSNLEEFILDRPEITLFTHGHTHEDFDYMIGATRIVCNPRGYLGYEARTASWQPRLIEL